MQGDSGTYRYVRRLKLVDQMSAVDSSDIRGHIQDKKQENTHSNPRTPRGSRKFLARSSLDSVSANTNTAAHGTGPTLLDIIKFEEPKQGQGYKELISNRKSWKSFRDKLRLKRAGAAWTSTLKTPKSDINLYQHRKHRNMVRWAESTQEMSHSNDSDNSTADGFGARPPLLRRISSRFGSSYQADENDSASPSSGNLPPVQGFKPAMSRHNSTRMPSSDDAGSTGDGFRQLSAREAAAAQEAAEAEATETKGDNGGGGEQPMMMSLMDLLEESDREMGLSGSRYRMEDEDDEDYEDEEYDDDADEDGGGSAEYTCSICMVKHKGPADLPCGHTFCRMCSRELMVAKGNCPLCNNFILEILDIF